MEYIFLSGVHGVGKTTLLNQVKKEMQIINISVSDLIRSAGTFINESDKFTESIFENQSKWRIELEKITVPDGYELILDGHFSLIDKDGDIKKLPGDTFDGIKVSKIIFKKEEPEIIKERLKKRDNFDWDLRKIESFQDLEEQLSLDFANENKLPFFCYKTDESFEELIKFIKS